MKVRGILDNSYVIAVKNDGGTRVVCIEDERRKANRCYQANR